MTEDPLIESLRRAVAAAPDDTTLRLHLATLLVGAGDGSAAVEHLAQVLSQDPGSDAARALMSRALGVPAAPPAPEQVPEDGASDEHAGDGAGFDWRRAESDLGDRVPPMFADSSAGQSEVAAYDVEQSALTLADVGGMDDVKKRLNAAFLAPMRNEKLRKMYGKSLRGGLMLYGPPGCGKTFIARALAGEIGAQFLTVSMAQILDMWIGNSEKNVHELFEVARASAPCVLFLDEVDAIGHKRSRLSSDGMRSAVNQLLLELDSVASDNAGLFVLAATNHPWDVDAALRRPGRLDRTLLVLPPDRDARVAIWRYHLSERPVAGIDLKRLAKLTEGYSGADIAHACDSASELALMESIDLDEPRMISQLDIETALRDIRPSVTAWFETARNVALFANEDGTYDDLAAYLRKNRKL
ncbi:tetratricopeptide repeat protein [Nocardioides sp. MH1]|uniref:tetratricopeptide repeat protein n=1 Tax=Nocardioides sp. MH1 TaxID=3242490 RepID=UPI0035217143